MDDTRTEAIVDLSRIPTVCGPCSDPADPSVVVMSPQKVVAMFRSRVSTSNAFLKSLSMPDPDVCRQEIRQSLTRLLSSRERKSITDTAMEISETITEFDLTVQETLLSLLAAGNRCITPHMIYFTMAGRYAKYTGQRSYPTARLTMEIDKSMVKARFTLCEFQTFRGDRRVQMKGPLLDFVKVPARNGVRTVDAYVQNTVPMLYRICSLTGAYSFVPIGQCRMDCNLTLKNISLISYLQRLIASRVWNRWGQCRIDTEGRTTSPVPMSVTIPYEDVYRKMKALEIRGSLRAKTASTSETYRRTRTRVLIAHVLDRWKNDRLIRDWVCERNEVEFISFTIHFFPVYADR